MAANVALCCAILLSLVAISTATIQTQTKGSSPTKVHIDDTTAVGVGGSNVNVAGISRAEQLQTYEPRVNVNERNAEVPYFLRGPSYGGYGGYRGYGGYGGGRGGGYFARVGRFGGDYY